MGRIQLNPECWNCGHTIKDDGVCPNCHMTKEDQPEPTEIDCWDGDNSQCE